MGSKPSLELTPNSDSLAVPGTKVVLSAEIPDLDYDEFLNTVVECLRYPLPNHDWHKEFLVKDVEVTFNGALEDFTVKVRFDGKLLDELKQGNGKGDDKIELWQRATVDRAAGKILVQIYHMGTYETPGLAADVVYIKSCTHVHRDPVRLELHTEALPRVIDPSNTSEEYLRGAGPSERDSFYRFVDPLVRQAKDKRVKMVRDMPSRKDPTKKCVMTEAMDDMTSYDAIFDAYLKKWSTPLSEHMIKKDEKEHEFTMVGPVLQFHVAHDREAGTLVKTDHFYGARLGAAHFQLYRDPLQLECWTHNLAGEQIAGQAFYRFWRRDVHETLEQCAG